MRVLYFAWLRERLDRGSDDIEPPDSVRTVGDLIGWLSARDEVAAAALQKRHLIKAAIDDRIVPLDSPIAGARQVALFPPMTGG